jgi:hypothetical protein
VSLPWDGVLSRFRCLAALRTANMRSPNHLAFGERMLYEVTAQPTIVIVNTKSNKLMLTTLKTFPCPSK